MNGCKYHAIEKSELKKKRSITFTREVTGVVQASNVEHSDREKGIVKETFPVTHSPLVLWYMGK